MKFGYNSFDEFLYPSIQLIVFILFIIKIDLATLYNQTKLIFLLEILNLNLIKEF